MKTAKKCANCRYLSNEKSIERKDIRYYLCELRTNKLKNGGRVYKPLVGTCESWKKAKEKDEVQN